MTPESRRRRGRVADGVVPPEFAGDSEGAWIEVIRKMDEVYSDLLRYESDLEEKNAALEEARAFISSVVESISDILIVCDPSGRIDQLNPAAVRLVGQTAESLIGTPFIELIEPSDRSNARRLLDLLPPSGVRECELRFLTPDGTSELFAVNCAALRNQARRRMGVVLMGRPIGELRRAYEALHTAHTELQRAQRALIEQEKMASLGRMVAGVAHELNNPISFVYGNIHVLERYRQRLMPYLAALESGIPADEAAALRRTLKIGALLDDYGPLIEGTLEGALRVSDIVRNLRRLSFGRSGEMQWVDLDSMIRTATRWASRTKRQEIEVAFDIQPGLQIRGDEQQFHQVIVNLVDNAIEAMRDQKRAVIEITARRTDQGVEITVGDHGPGIAVSILDKIFEPFFTTRPAGEGTGLGLWISYSIVHEYGGALSATNRPEGGAIFKMILPDMPEI